MSPMLSRRRVLSLVAGGVTGALPFVFAARPLASTDGHRGDLPQWTYDGVTGPEHWSELSPDYASCQFGISQSPIDLVDAKKVVGDNVLSLGYRPIAARAMHGAAGIALSLDPGSQVRFQQQTFRLSGLRICLPSEHLLSGRALDMELQFKHESDAGSVAMVSLFVRQGADNAALAAVLEAFSMQAATTQTSALFPFNPAALLPDHEQDRERLAFYTYGGSLTAPPCTEGVRWIIFKSPVEASPQQIRELASLSPRNARPAQPVNARVLLEYSGRSASVAP